MKTPPKLYRQGDVLLELVASIPSAAKRVKCNGEIVLAYGESTGHHHAIKKGTVRHYRDPETQASYVEVAEAMAMLEHEEHAPIALEPGIYRVTLQREYHPEEIRRVAD